jgi:hydrogenase maturation protease HycI
MVPIARMPTATSSWRRALRRTLLAGRKGRPLRTAIVGVGHELRGDDAAGVAVARGLRAAIALRCLQNVVADRLYIADAGPAPENYAGPLRCFEPDLVLLVDAAQLGATPGTVRYLAWQETCGLSASTHTLPPYVIAHYLSAALGCEVALIGIQPADTSFGAPLSPPVSRAVAAVVQALADLLQPLRAEIA